MSTEAFSLLRRQLKNQRPDGNGNVEVGAAALGRVLADFESYRSALIELRCLFHSAGRRPEECHEMSLIDEALV